MKYEIKGEPTPVVICELSAGESMITEKGSMVWMSPNMEMQTSAGGLGKAFGRDVLRRIHLSEHLYSPGPVRDDCFCV